LVHNEKRGAASLKPSALVERLFSSGMIVLLGL